MSAKVQFFILIIVSYVVSLIPIVSRPFEWVETYFHELSHGLAAIVSGGAIHSIQLNWDGSGLCTTQGGLRLLVSFSGYMGAQVMAVIVYLIGSGMSQIMNRLFVASILVLLVLSAVLWSANLVSLLIHGVLFALFLVSGFKLPGNSVPLAMRFIGSYVLISSMVSPFYQWGASQSDAATLASLTFIPASIWMIIWAISGLACFIFLFRYHSSHSGRSFA